MRDGDGPAHDQRDGQRLLQLGVADSGFMAAGHVVLDAVVAAQRQRGHQAHQLFGFDRQRAFAVHLAIQAPEPLDALPGIFHDEVVQPLALGLEVVYGGHGETGS